MIFENTSRKWTKKVELRLKIMLNLNLKRLKIKCQIVMLG